MAHCVGRARFRPGATPVSRNKLYPGRSKAQGAEALMLRRKKKTAACLITNKVRRLPDD